MPGDWPQKCERCGCEEKQTGIIDRDKDCLVAWMCPRCELRTDRSIGEIIIVQDTSGAPDAK